MFSDPKSISAPDMLQSTTKRSNYRILIRFLAINLVISMCHGYRYILNSPDPQSLLSQLFIHAALASTFMLIYAALTLILSIPALATASRKILFPVFVLTASVIQLIIFVDISIFRIFNFHINSMVINLLMTEKTGDVLHFGVSTITMFTLAVVFVIGFESALIYFLNRKTADKPISRRLAILFIALSVIVIAGEKVAFAVSDLYNNREITRYVKLYPLYQPLTIKRFMRKHFDFEMNRDQAIRFENTRTSLQYPKAPLERPSQGDYPNILWIVLDAYRFDMLNRAVTPNIYGFSQKALVFKNHYSGGNCTRFGIFSLFYGIHGSYWHRFLGENQSPVLIDELKRLGYHFNIITSASCSNPEFIKTAFVNIPDKVTDNFEGSVDQKDQQVTETFLNWLDIRDPARPFFAFLFYDAAHGPYIYPDRFDRYQPSIRDPNYLTIGPEDAVPLKNTYQNALLFNDSETGKILDRLESEGLFQNTAILITGDHGEAFGEDGLIGHGGSFSAYQTKVPFILYVPGTAPSSIGRLTCHQDAVPTFLNLLGYAEAPEIYSHGRSLLNADETTRPHDYIVSSSWGECAVYDGRHYICFSLESHNLGFFEIRNNAYELAADTDTVFKARRRQVLSVLEEFREFTR